MKGHGPQNVSQREALEAAGCEAEWLPGHRVQFIPLEQSMPRAAMSAEWFQANTGGMSKNSSCNLILSIYLLSQGVTEDADTCVLQSFLEVGRLYKRWQGDRVGDLSQGLPSGGAHCPSQ